MMNIIFDGIFKGKPVDVNTKEYSQFMINRLLSQIDDGKYVDDIIAIDKLGELTNEEHYIMVTSKIKPGYHKMWRKPHIFAIVQEYTTLVNEAEMLKKPIDKYIQDIKNMSPAARRRHKTMIDNYKKQITNL